MKYQVDISENAKSDLRRYFHLAFQDAPRTAERWLERFQAELATLADFPQRWGLAPESKLTGIEVRQMFFGKHRGAFRVLFAVQGDQVRVLHIRRASRDVANLDDLLAPNRRRVDSNIRPDSLARIRAVIPEIAVEVN